MRNPFCYFGIVMGKSFCNRDSEISHMADLIRDSQNILLYSRRKTGKSSLIFELYRRMNEPKSDIQCMYVDLYGTATEQDFANALLAALPQIEPQFMSVLQAFSGISLASSVDPSTGTHSFSVSAGPAKRKHLLSSAMNILKSYSHRNRLAVAMDEFQEVSQYREEGFEKRLYSYIQTHDRIAFIFSGRKAHLLPHSVPSSRGAFYESAYSFSLQQIQKADYVYWAKNHFASKNVDLPQHVAENIVERCEYQPMYIQQFFYRLWQSRTLDLDKVESIEREIIRSHRSEYMTIFDNLTANQKKALKLIAKTGGRSMYQVESLLNGGFSTASQLTRAIKSLLSKELITKNGTYQIQDVMLRKWIMALR